jgi:hypothetical protein
MIQSHEGELTLGEALLHVCSILCQNHSLPERSIPSLAVSWNQTFAGRLVHVLLEQKSLSFFGACAGAATVREADYTDKWPVAGKWRLSDLRSLTSTPEITEAQTIVWQ